jgi:hypothetical protein
MAKGGKQASNAKASGASTKKQKKDDSWKKIVLVIVAGVVVLMLVAALLVNNVTKEPVKVSNAMIADIQAKDGAGAYVLFSSDAQKVIPKDQFNQLVNQIGPILNGSPKITDKEVNGHTGQPATAKVVYEIKGSDNQTYSITVNLTKENGAWKVVNFDSKKN